MAAHVGRCLASARSTRYLNSCFAEQVLPLDPDEEPALFRQGFFAPALLEEHLVSGPVVEVLGLAVEFEGDLLLLQAKSSRCSPTVFAPLLRLRRLDPAAVDQFPRQGFAGGFGAGVGSSRARRRVTDSVAARQRGCHAPGAVAGPPRAAAHGPSGSGPAGESASGSSPRLSVPTRCTAGRPLSHVAARRRAACGTAHPCRGAHSTGARCRRWTTSSTSHR